MAKTAKVTQALNALLYKDGGTVYGALLEHYVQPWYQSRQIDAEIYNRALEEHQFLQERAQQALSEEPHPVSGQDQATTKAREAKSTSSENKSQGADGPQEREVSQTQAADRSKRTTYAEQSPGGRDERTRQDGNVSQLENKQRNLQNTVKEPQQSTSSANRAGPEGQGHKIHGKVDVPPALEAEPKGTTSLSQTGQTNATVDHQGNIDTNKQQKEDEIENLKKQLADAFTKKVNQEMIIYDLGRHLDKNQIEIERLVKERNDFRLRLSKLAGDKMTDGNPNIADLSDPNRPTQLGTRYTEIYDNEWSDAFEALQAVKIPDTDSIKYLWKIINDSYKYCENTITIQLGEIRNKLIDPIEQNRGKYTKTLSSQEKRVTEDELYVSLKEFRRKYAPKTAQLVAMDFVRRCLELPEQLKNEQNRKALETYTKVCTEICWFMLVADPPVVMTSLNEGELYDTAKYKEYTRSIKGLKDPTVEMTVWPCLLLHQQGPVLAKGIAQPAGQKKLKSPK